MMAAASPSPPAPKRVDYVCSFCDGNTVTRDAWAAWDADEQDWVLGAAFDYAYCHDCDSETNLVEVDLATRTPTEASGVR